MYRRLSIKGVLQVTKLHIRLSSCSFCSTVAPILIKFRRIVPKDSGFAQFIVIPQSTLIASTIDSDSAHWFDSCLYFLILPTKSLQ